MRWKTKFLLQWWPILTFMWCTFWFIFLFSPLEQGDAYIKKLSPTNVAYYNVSRKPFPSELICQIVDSKTILSWSGGEVVVQNPRTSQWGTGNSDWTTWKVVVPVPFGADVLNIHKELTYTCLGIFYKKVHSAERIFSVDRD